MEQPAAEAIPEADASDGGKVDRQTVDGKGDIKLSFTVIEFRKRGIK
jgi:hypothetical protein